MAQGNPGLAPSPSLGSELGGAGPACVLLQSERSRHAEKPEAAKGRDSWGRGNFTRGPCWSQGRANTPGLLWGAQSRLRLRRGRGSPSREMGRQPGRALGERILTNWRVRPSTWDTGLPAFRPGKLARQSQSPSGWGLVSVCLGGEQWIGLGPGLSLTSASDLIFTICR